MLWKVSGKREGVRGRRGGEGEEKWRENRRREIEGGGIGRGGGKGEVEEV